MASSVKLDIKPKSLSPSGKRDLSQTLSSLCKDGKNQEMKNIFKSIGCTNKEEAEKSMKILTATYIIQSLDPDSGKSNMRVEDLKELLPYFKEEKTTEESRQESPPGAVDSGSAKQQENNTVHESTGRTKSYKDKEIPREANKLVPQKSDSSPVWKKKADNNQNQKSEMTATVGAPGNEIQGPEKNTDSKKPKLDHGQKSDSTAGVIEKKDKELQKLDGELKSLKNNLTMMESGLNKALAEKDESQDMVKKLKSENTDLSSQIKELLTEKTNLKDEITKTENCIKKLTTDKAALEGNLEKLRKYMDKVQRENKRTLEDLIENNDKEVRLLNGKLSEVIKERDDLKTRFSKLAGAKLTDQNADIADLSDPNRAMKLSEKFGQMYDDEWTDAFEELKKKKMEGKDAIQLLLSILKGCHVFCNNLKEAQIDSLNNVLLHPSQDVTKFAMEHRKNIGGLKERPRIPSKDEKAVRNLRRQIGVSTSCIEEVKQVFVLETKSWEKQGYDKKQLEVCIPYIQKCAEVCWLMVLHDPPLYMKMDASHGDKMDPNLYTVYSTSGEKIDYLVWPPLYNEAGGGLISKGVAECLRVIKKN